MHVKKIFKVKAEEEKKQQKHYSWICANSHLGPTTHYPCDVLSNQSYLGIKE